MSDKTKAKNTNDEGSETGFTSAVVVEESDSDKLEKQYQENGFHVPEGYKRRLVTKNGVTSPVYTESKKA